MIKCIVFDKKIPDSRLAADVLSDCFEEALNEKLYEIEVKATNDFTLLLNDESFDLAFICPDNIKNAALLLKKLRALHRESIICILSENGDFALFGYSISISDYIIKPFTRKKAENVLSKVFELLNPYKSSIAVKINKRLIRLDTNQILYIESSNKRLIFHLLSACFEMTEKLDVYWKMLSTRRDFLRCHKSYLVNLAHVKSLEGRFFVMANDDRIPIPKDVLGAVKKNYYKYLSEK